MVANHLYAIEICVLREQQEVFTQLRETNRAARKVLENHKWDTIALFLIEN